MVLIRVKQKVRRMCELPHTDIQPDNLSLGVCYFILFKTKLALFLEIPDLTIHFNLYLNEYNPYTTKIKLVRQETHKACIFNSIVLFNLSHFLILEYVSILMTLYLHKQTFHGIVCLYLVYHFPKYGLFNKFYMEKKYLSIKDICMMPDLII